MKNWRFISPVAAKYPQKPTGYAIQFSTRPRTAAVTEGQQTLSTVYKAEISEKHNTIYRCNDIDRAAEWPIFNTTEDCATNTHHAAKNKFEKKKLLIYGFVDRVKQIKHKEKS